MHTCDMRACTRRDRSSSGIPSRPANQCVNDTIAALFMGLWPVSFWIPIAINIALSSKFLVNARRPPHGRYVLRRTVALLVMKAGCPSSYRGTRADDEIVTEDNKLAAFIERGPLDACSVCRAHVFRASKCVSLDV